MCKFMISVKDLSLQPGKPRVNIIYTLWIDYVHNLNLYFTNLDSMALLHILHLQVIAFTVLVFQWNRQNDLFTFKWQHTS